MLFIFIEVYLVFRGSFQGYPQPTSSSKKRISLKNTRAIIDAIISGEIDSVITKTIPFLNLTIPTALPNVSTGILDPRDTYKNEDEWERKAKDLSARYIQNFEQYTDTEEGKRLVAAGPSLESVLN